MVSFGWNWPLAAPPGPGTVRNQNLSTVGTSGLPRQPLATILGPLPTTSPNFGPCPLPETLTPLPFFFVFSVTRQTAMPIRTAPRFCLGGVVGLKSYCMVVEIRRDCMCRALGLFLTHKQCAVETEQMSSVETGQVSAVETS